MATNRRTTRRSPTAAAADDRATLAYGTLRDLIVRGWLAPGSRVVETAVARRLGISRTPVRSALQRLQQEGYIVLPLERQRQNRAFVAPLTQEDARELFGIVAEVEGLAARWAAERPANQRSALAEELETLNRRLVEASRVTRPDQNVLFDVDSEFHRRYVEGGAGIRLLALHDAIKPQTERYIRLYVSVLVDQIGVSVGEHASIIAAIAEGAPDRAQAAARTNWHNATSRLARVIEMAVEPASR
ncbi:MAG: GntR family transcriptional regulator [Gemmatimonadaceae bacterium]